jgi:hypothetical protein
MTNLIPRLIQVERRLTRPHPKTQEPSLIEDLVRLCVARADCPLGAGTAQILAQRAELDVLITAHGWEQGSAAWLADPCPALVVEIAAQRPRWEAMAG